MKAGRVRLLVTVVAAGLLAVVGTLYTLMHTGVEKIAVGKLIKIERIDEQSGFHWEGMMMRSPPAESSTEVEPFLFTIGQDLELLSKISGYVGQQRPITLRYQELHMRNPRRGRTANLARDVLPAQP